MAITLNDGDRGMEADKRLAERLANAKTKEEFNEILYASVEDANIAQRDPATGRFVATGENRELTVSGEPKVTPHRFGKTEVIAGKKLIFEAESEDALNAQIADAYRVAEALKQQQVQNAAAENGVYDLAELRMQLVRGEITPEQFVERSGTIPQYLEDRGITVGEELYEASWALATERFLQTSEGQSFPKSERNLEILSRTVFAMGLEDTVDKTTAMAAAYAEMRRTGTVFDADPTVEQANAVALDASATPYEILEAWKAANGGDPEAANRAFVENNSRDGHAAGRNEYDGSKLFGR